MHCHWHHHWLLETYCCSYYLQNISSTAPSSALHCFPFQSRTCASDWPSLGHMTTADPQRTMGRQLLPLWSPYSERRAPNTLKTHIMGNFQRQDRNSNIEYQKMANVTAQLFLPQRLGQALYKRNRTKIWPSPSRSNFESRYYILLFFVTPRCLAESKHSMNVC